MSQTFNLDRQTLARWAGWSLLAGIIVGILTAVFVSEGIDINMSADVSTTATNMLEAETRLRAKAYLSILTLILEIVFAACLYLLLRQYNVIFALSSLLISLSGALLFLLGGVFAMNAAEIAGNVAYSVGNIDAQRLMLSKLQATSDYTSFHMGLVISTFSKAVFFYLFYTSKLIPKLIAGWGVFASLFVSFTIVARDFVPVLANNAVTAAFMISNLVAIISLGLYLVIRGVTPKNFATQSQ